MRREELEIDDGLLCLVVNGKSEVVFNPTDIGFLERVYRVFEQLDGIQEQLDKRIHGSSPADIFIVAREADAQMRALVDGVMGEETCEKQFGDMNVYARADGLPVWANLLLAVLDRCEAEVDTQTARMSPRLEKYAKKWGRKK